MVDEVYRLARFLFLRYFMDRPGLSILQLLSVLETSANVKSLYACGWGENMQYLSNHHKLFQVHPFKTNLWSPKFCAYFWQSNLVTWDPEYKGSIDNQVSIISSHLGLLKVQSWMLSIKVHEPHFGLRANTEGSNRKSRAPRKAGSNKRKQQARSWVWMLPSNKNPNHIETIQLCLLGWTINSTKC